MNRKSIDGLVAAIAGNAVEKIQERISVAIEKFEDNPEAYFQSHAGDFDKRGLDEYESDRIQEIRQIAWIDQLEQESLAAELDWKASLEEWKEAALLVLQAKGLKNTLDSDDEDSEEDEDEIDDAEGCIDFISNALNREDLTLVIFKLDSDSYPMTIIPTEKVEDFEIWADEMLLEVTCYT